MCNNLKKALSSVQIKPDSKISAGSKRCFNALNKDMTIIEDKIDKLDKKLEQVVVDQKVMNKNVLDTVTNLDQNIKHLNHTLFEDKTSEKAYMLDSILHNLFGSKIRAITTIGIIAFAGIGIVGTVERLLDKSHNIKEIITSTKQ